MLKSTAANDVPSNAETASLRSHPPKAMCEGSRKRCLGLGVFVVIRLIESVDAAEDFGEDPWDGQSVLAMRVPITSAIDRGAANDACEGAINSSLSGRGRPADASSRHRPLQVFERSARVILMSRSANWQ
jgi:hypothetical protein